MAIPRQNLQYNEIDLTEPTFKRNDKIPTVCPPKKGRKYDRTFYECYYKGEAIYATPGLGFESVSDIIKSIGKSLRKAGADEIVRTQKDFTTTSVSLAFINKAQLEALKLDALKKGEAIIKMKQFTTKFAVDSGYSEPLVTSERNFTPAIVRSINPVYVTDYQSQYSNPANLNFVRQHQFLNPINAPSNTYGTFPWNEGNFQPWGMSGYSFPFNTSMPIYLQPEIYRLPIANVYSSSTSSTSQSERQTQSFDNDNISILASYDLMPQFQLRNPKTGGVIAFKDYDAIILPEHSQAIKIPSFMDKAVRFFCSPDEMIYFSKYECCKSRKLRANKQIADVVKAVQKFRQSGYADPVFFQDNKNPKYFVPKNQDRVNNRPSKKAKLVVAVEPLDINDVYRGNSMLQSGQEGSHDNSGTLNNDERKVKKRKSPADEASSINSPYLANSIFSPINNSTLEAEQEDAHDYSYIVEDVPLDLNSPTLANLIFSQTKDSTFQPEKQDGDNNSYIGDDAYVNKNSRQ